MQVRHPWAGHQGPCRWGVPPAAQAAADVCRFVYAAQHGWQERADYLYRNAPGFARLVLFIIRFCGPRSYGRWGAAVSFVTLSSCARTTRRLPEHGQLTLSFYPTPFAAQGSRCIIRPHPHAHRRRSTSKSVAARAHRQQSLPLLPAHYTDWQTFLEPALVRKLCGMEGDVFADMCSDLQVNAQSLVIYTSGCGPSSPSAVLCLVLSLALSVYACVFV